MSRPFVFEAEPFELPIESGEWKSDGLSKTFEMEFAEGGQKIKISRTRQDYIRRVQQSLNKVMGLNLKVDGIMGPETRNAVRTFQERRGLPITGLVGPDTERALIATGSGQSPRGDATKAAVRRLPEPAEPVAAPSAGGFNFQ